MKKQLYIFTIICLLGFALSGTLLSHSAEAGLLTRLLGPTVQFFTKTHTTDDMIRAASRSSAPSIPRIRNRNLPQQARETQNLIKKGGPFPYDRDGAEFMNREGKLPAKPNGHYREYTVPSPGKPNRGARRIVAGKDGEMYYTDDHYNTFQHIVD